MDWELVWHILESPGGARNMVKYYSEAPVEESMERRELVTKAPHMWYKT